ncbi:MAG: bile acid:sodium symporter family protein [Gammaproteobacteria bacterium]|nr:bile acid:sodium symporter family protein [Gammaproteobacteria bacterium]MCP5417383.1 bile acid:sodium symporter family protein [Chromatiaceae bacterium]
MELDQVAQTVLAIGLMIIMFGIGLSLSKADFIAVLKFPRAVAAGLTAQFLGLPLAALIITQLFQLSPEFALGFMIIATSPGGATSNLFSFLMRGDVALSVSLTAIATVLSLFTIPVVLAYASQLLLQNSQLVALPIGRIFFPLLFLVLLPLILGMLIRSRKPGWAAGLQRPTASLSVLLLIFTVCYVFYLEQERFITYGGQLGWIVSLFFLTATLLGFLVAKAARLDLRQQKTVVIEVGIQNGVQAIFIATSPLMFADPVLAVPAVLYSILMYLYIFVLFIVLKFLRL